jgi:tetratricopeptide (TPR) repeat protein
MKTFLITVLFLISGMVSGQSVDKIIKQIDREERKGDSLAALDLGLRTDNLYKDNDEIFSFERALLKKRIGSLFYSAGNKAEAEKYYSTAIELFQEDYGIEDLEYVMALNEYSQLLMDEDRNDEADSLLIEAIQFQDDSDLNNTPVYMLTLYNQGLLYISRGNFVEAETKLEQATAMNRPTVPEYSRIHSEAFILLAEVYAKREKYSEAITIYKTGLKSFRKRSPEYSYWLSELADIYTQINQYETAKPLYFQVLETERSSGRDKTAEYADYLNKLGALYRESGDYVKSLKLHQEALQLQESGVYDTSDTYFNLAALYTLTADFASAEEAIGKMITKEEMEEKNGFNYISYLNLMGNLYTLTGNYGKAEKYYKEVIDKAREPYGNEHSADYAVNIDNLANLYLRMDKDEMAKPLIIKAMEIKKSIYGDTHSDIAYSLGSLSEISIREKNYDEAENYLREVLRISKECFGEDHSDYGNALLDLAIINLNNKKYAEAEKLLRECTFILRNNVGENHPNYNSALTSFARLYNETARQDSAELLYLRINENLHYQIKRNFSYLSEKEKENYISKLSKEFSDFNNFVSERKSENPSITGIAWNNLMALKGIVLTSSRAMRQAIMNSGDETLIDQYEDLNSVKRLLLEQEKLPAGQRWFNIDSLERLSVLKEKELSIKLKSSQGFKDFSGLENSITWQEIQGELNDNEAAIEFFSIESDIVTYYALVLTHVMKFPVMVKLFSEPELTNFIAKNNAGNDAATAERLYSLYANSSVYRKNLYEIIWEPIESSLEGIETIYYSPSGILNQIAFDAIPLKDGKYLSDRYKLVELLSTRDILNKPDEILATSVNKKAVFYGGINYDTDVSKLQASGRAYPQQQISGRTLLSDESSRGSGFVYLEGTLTEVQNIETLLNKRNIPSIILSGDDATEESFKSLDNLNSPVCLHIATHGFFFPHTNSTPGSRSASGQDTYRYADNPLLRSGLVFAGGNNIWKNRVIPKDTEDGILLASEVSEMYLPNTRLVVLSACETGLGDILGSEGVYGLQRSFKMAGAKFMIISLWQVPDYQTSELMNKFYENWISEKGIHDSFREAQNYMKLKYPSMPSVWAAFVLVE